MTTTASNTVCPYCKAAALAPCVTSSGRKAAKDHAGRKAAAQASSLTAAEAQAAREYSAKRAAELEAAEAYHAAQELARQARQARRAGLRQALELEAEAQAAEELAAALEAEAQALALELERAAEAEAKAEAGPGHYVPAIDGRDTLGDSWAARIGRIWDRMALADPEATSRPGSYAAWQWAMCTLSGLPGRVVVSPEIAGITGTPYASASELEALLALSDSILKPKPRPRATDRQAALSLALEA